MGSDRRSTNGGGRRDLLQEDASAGKFHRTISVHTLCGIRKKAHRHTRAQRDARKRAVELAANRGSGLAIK